MLSRPVGFGVVAFFKFIQICFAWSIFKGELYFREFVRCTFNFRLRSNDYEPMSFKVDMMIDATNFYILTPA